MLWVAVSKRTIAETAYERVKELPDHVVETNERSRFISLVVALEALSVQRYAATLPDERRRGRTRAATRPLERAPVATMGSEGEISGPCSLAVPAIVARAPSRRPSVPSLPAGASARPRSPSV